MPTYKLLNKNTNEEFEEFMGISELQEYLSINPHIEQLVNGAPSLHSGRGLKKPDAGFRDLLTTIKKGNSKGLRRSTVNNF
jgi:hypothetical protein